MTIENLHEAFIERNGGLEVFRWIIEQDGVANYNTVKIYPIIAWNEFHHDGIIVVGSAYRNGEYFVVINYEENYNYIPERLKVWVEDAMDFNNYDNIIEVFRDNHLIAICDENMEMMVKWYGEDMGIENIINFASYDNNIVFEDEVEMNDVIIQKEDNDYLTQEAIKNISNLLNELISPFNRTLNNEDNLKNLQDRYKKNNKFINNTSYRPQTPNPYNFFQDENVFPTHTYEDFHEDFKEKWT